jgi:cbb3-type cytochrome oxidase maturation protein
MSIIYLLAPLSLLLALFFVFLFYRSISSGQFEDLETPAHRILIDSPNLNATQEKEANVSSTPVKH